MDSLGTVTMYFPFIDGDTKEVLESMMIEAEDYDDFVRKLSSHVLTRDCPDMLVYFSVHFAANLEDHKIISKIREKYSGRELVEVPLNFYSSDPESYRKAHEAADAILETNPEDWMVLEMLCYKIEADMMDYPNTIYQQSDLDRIREIIHKDPRLRYYELTLMDNLGHRAYTDGDFEEMLQCLDQGIQLAEEFNDRLRLCSFLYKKAKFVKGEDRKHAENLLRRAYDLNDELRISTHYANIIYELSILRAIRGEFDSAIKQSLQVVSLRESSDLNTGNASLLLSTFYNMIGESESGLEWGLMAEDQFGSRPHLKPRGILNQVWSLILLDRLSEAQLLLDTTRETILKSGRETLLAWLHFVTGLLEFADGNPTSASSSIEEALKIYEDRVGALQVQLIFLYYLAKIEVANCSSNDLVFPSLAILEEKTTSEDLPGILGLVLLLKGEIALVQNDESSIREIIKQLRPLTETESMQYLQPSFDSLMSRL